MGSMEQHFGEGAGHSPLRILDHGPVCGSRTAAWLPRDVTVASWGRAPLLAELPRVLWAGADGWSHSDPV